MQPEAYRNCVQDIINTAILAGTLFYFSYDTEMYRFKIAQNIEITIHNNFILENRIDMTNAEIIECLN